MSDIRVVVMGAAGRMGGLIARLAMDAKGVALAGVVDCHSRIGDLQAYGCQASDSLERVLESEKHCVVIDFTVADVAISSARVAAAREIPIVIGTTGFSGEQKAELSRLAASSPVLWSSNMSIGVNVLMRMLPELAAALGPGYNVEMLEIHHRNKKDAPSGTALMLGEAVARARGLEFDRVRQSCRDGMGDARPDDEIGIMALRGGDVVGMHSVYFLGPGEIIEVKHQAESRENFAQGALRAARWLASQQPGRLYSMQDVIS